MKKQPSKIENATTSILAFILSFAICALIWIARKIVWPVLRFCAKAAWKGVRSMLAKSKIVKPSKPPVQLPIPDIFKGEPNLGPARSFDFKKM